MLIALLRDNPLLLLFAVAAIGYPLGRLRVGGHALGIAAVLFVGLAFGAIDETLALPDLVYQLGLVLFVYTVGASSGPAFFDALGRKGLRDNLLVATLIAVATGLTIAMAHTLTLGAAQGAGLFAGALTNTPALAAVLETLARHGSTSAAGRSAAVVGYSIAYPLGVLGVIMAIALAQRIWRIDYRREARALEEFGASPSVLVNHTIRVRRPAGQRASIADAARHAGGAVRFARIGSGSTVRVATPDDVLADGDLVSVVGHPEDVERLVAWLGERADEPLELDRSVLDFRRIFVSHPRAVARRVSDLDLLRRFGATITRVRRGDVDFVARDDTILEPGDRVRVVAPRDRLAAIGDFLGDSYRHLSEIDVLTFSLGICAGLLLGSVDIPLPGGGAFRLGIAGGPLLVALVLSKLDRTGPLVWSLPYGANLTIRQFGLVLFLAGIGTRAGGAFADTMLGGGGWQILLAGAVISTSTALLLLVIGYRLLRIPMSVLIGMVAGLQTNPAVLSYATEQTRNDLPNVGYATVYPVAMIVKIILAQVLLSVLS